MKKLIINAVNIHQGGGSKLLLALLNEVKFNKSAYVILDERINARSIKFSKFNIKFITPSLWARFLNEINLYLNTKKNDILLCMGNLPPLFKSQSHVIVFVQNCYILNRNNLQGFPLRVKIRIFIERFWFDLRISNVDEFVVQTQSMKKLLLDKIKVYKPIHQIPFIANDYISSNYDRLSMNKRSSEEFVYVSSGEPHKNHKNLIKAWCLLAQAGFFPKLTITLDLKKYKKLCCWIKSQAINYRINVVNVGCVDNAKIKALYAEASALIFPSTLESFGLPLIEAKAMNLRILASELDYVRDLIDPDEVFNPESPLSISRSVRRFIRKPENRLPIKSAKQFLTQLHIV